MAENQISASTIVCSICYEPLHDARILSCNHFICRTCLGRLESPDHPGEIPCPLCRCRTTLDTELGVDCLPRYYSANYGMLDADLNIHDNKLDGTLFAEVESRICSMCNDGDGEDEPVDQVGASPSVAVAVTYCRDCKEFMCDACTTGHARMKRLFSNHSVIPVHSTLRGLSAADDEDKCRDHPSETKDYFCRACMKHVCSRCTQSLHKNHDCEEALIIEKESKGKLDSLLMQLKGEKREIEGSVRNIERTKNEVRDILNNLHENIAQAHQLLVDKLGERKKTLLKELDGLGAEHTKNLDDLKTEAIASSSLIMKSSTQLESGWHSGLRGDRWKTYLSTCHNAKVQSTAGDNREKFLEVCSRVKQEVEKVTFVLSANDDLDIGHLAERNTKQQNILQNGAMKNDMLHFTGKFEENPEVSEAIRRISWTDSCDTKARAISMSCLSKDGSAGGKQVRTYVDQKTVPNHLAHFFQEVCDEDDQSQLGHLAESTCKHADDHAYATWDVLGVDAPFRHAIFQSEPLQITPGPLSCATDIPITRMSFTPRYFRSLMWEVSEIRLTYNDPTCLSLHPSSSVALVVGYSAYPAVSISPFEADFRPRHFQPDITADGVLDMKILSNGRIVAISRSGDLQYLSSDGYRIARFRLPTPMWKVDTDEDDEVFILPRLASEVYRFRVESDNQTVRPFYCRYCPTGLLTSRRCLVIKTSVDIVGLSVDDGSEMWWIYKGKSSFQCAIDRANGYLLVAVHTDPDGTSKRSGVFQIETYKLDDGELLESQEVRLEEGTKLTHMVCVTHGIIALTTASSIVILKRI